MTLSPSGHAYAACGALGVRGGGGGAIDVGALGGGDAFAVAAAPSISWCFIAESAEGFVDEPGSATMFPSTVLGASVVFVVSTSMMTSGGPSGVMRGVVAGEAMLSEEDDE